MRAAVHTRYGQPDVISIVDVPKPEPKEGEILIKVIASTVNRTDTGFRSGTPFVVRFFSGLLKPRRSISGTEFSGVVEAVGGKVTTFTVGDEVCGRTEDEKPGTHAEFLCLPETAAVASKPASLGFSEAASLCDGAMLANGALKCIDFERPQRVLVNGASGAIGAAAFQLVKARGAEVTAVCKTEAVDAVRALGADHVIDYKKEDFTQLDERFDVVLDAVGKSTLGRCKRLLGDGGIYFSTELGPWCQNPLLAIKTKFFGGRFKVYFPIPKYLKEEVVEFGRLADEGKYRPLIDRSYPLEEIVAASEYVETGEKIGNVVIEVAV